MAAWFTMPLVLALCVALAAAYRDDVDLDSSDDLDAKATTAALLWRTGASANAKAGDASVGDAKLDLALKRKEKGESLIESAAVFQAAGVKDISTDVRASFCNGIDCWCLDVTSATKNLAKYMDSGNGGLKIKDIVETKGNDDCHAGRRAFCLEPWSWIQFLEHDEGNSADGVGLNSHNLDQSFTISGRSEFHAKLYRLQEDDEKVHNVSFQVMHYHGEAGGSKNDVAKVGLEGGSEPKEWVVRKRTGAFGGDNGWGVKNGAVEFGITREDEATWKVKRKGKKAYAAHTDESLWGFNFYTDEELDATLWFQTEKTLCSLWVRRGEDAGLLLITSMLMVNFYGKEC